MALTEGHHPIETLVLDRPHESFSVGVRIGRLKGRQRDVHAGIVQLPTYLPAPLPVTIADQHTMSVQHAVIRRCHEAHDLAHEHVIGMGSGSEYLDAARGEIDDEHRVVRH